MTERFSAEKITGSFQRKISISPIVMVGEDVFRLGESQTIVCCLLMSSYSSLIDNESSVLQLKLRTYVDRKIQQFECQRYEIMYKIFTSKQFDL